jgi:hypothetical protein
MDILVPALTAAIIVLILLKAFLFINWRNVRKFLQLVYFSHASIVSSRDERARKIKKFKTFYQVSYFP